MNIVGLFAASELRRLLLWVVIALFRYVKGTWIDVVMYIHSKALPCLHKTYLLTPASLL